MAGFIDSPGRLRTVVAHLLLQGGGPARALAAHPFFPDLCRIVRGEIIAPEVYANIVAAVAAYQDVAVRLAARLQSRAPLSRPSNTPHFLYAPGPADGDPLPGAGVDQDVLQLVAPAGGSSTPPRATLYSRMIEEGMATQEEIRRWQVTGAKERALSFTLAVREWVTTGDYHKLERLKTLMHEVHGIPYVDPAGIREIDAELRVLIPLDRALSYNVIPYQRSADTLYVITHEPIGVATLDEIGRFVGGYKIEAIFAFEHEIRDAIPRLYAADAPDDIGFQPVTDAGSEIRFTRGRRIVVDVKDLKSPGMEAYVTRLLVQAHESGASDVHIERRESGAHIRLRKDGQLRPALSEAREKELAPHAAEVVRRLMVMAGLKIDQEHLPQDGRCQIRMTKDGNDIRSFDLRLVTIPTVFGPTVTIRIQRREDFSLAKLGLGRAQFEMVQERITSPHGLILITGPTGSGKTTTAYSVLAELNRPEVKIWTAEDPVEQETVGLNQVAIERGVTFADALRAFLRGDPDIIFVGEIRDRETALMAAQAANTGHLVISSLHTNDALSTVERLAKLGIDDFILAEILRCVVSQRLVSRICRNCRTKIVDPSHFSRVRGSLPPELRDTPFYSGTGCDKCERSGLLGRIGAFEVVPACDAVTHHIFGLAAGTATRAETEARLREQGIELFRDAAIRMLVAGDITPEGFEELLGGQGGLA